MIKRLGVIAALAFAACLAFPAFAQPTSSYQAITPLTRDAGALQTLTLQSAATVNSSDQTGYNVSRIICVFKQTASSGSPSTTFSIQNKDAASGQYYSLITSSAITDTTTTAVAAGAGVTTTANVGSGRPIARTWRTTVTVGGSATPLVTATVGCSVQ